MILDKLTGQPTFTSLRPCDLSSCTKKEIKAYFENSYDLNESLFTALKDENAMYKCPDRLRLPLVFYLAHTAGVYINKMILGGLIQPSDRINLEFETLFETGVDEMSWDDTENYRMGGKFQWPSTSDVMMYRRDVRNLILRVIEETPLEMPITNDNPWWALFMGMEHERIHIETSSVLIRQLPVEMVSKPLGWTYGPIKWGEPVLDNPLIKVPATTVTLGKPADFPSYGWDNEYGQCKIEVPAFEASKFLVTNREFLAFVKAGGYDIRSFWTQEGWDWVQFCQARHPTFWVCGNGCQSGCGANLVDYTHCKPTEFVNSPHISNGNQNGYSHGNNNGCTEYEENGQKDENPHNHLTNGLNSYCNGHSTVDQNGHQGKDEGGGTISQEYKLRCMFDVVDMALDWPVEVNYHEAKAFCKWKGPDYRLPAEAEHCTMQAPQGPEEGINSDIIYQEEIAANLNMKHGSSTPVNMYPPSAAGFHDLSGNVWEWTEDHFNGLPGYSSNYLYDDFSSPCFDGRHNIILGGSWISTGDEASRFARYAFRRHFFQHLGFRVVHNVAGEQGARPCLPVHQVTTDVYIPGLGVPANPTLLGDDNTDAITVPSTNPQLVSDTDQQLQVMLVQEYGDLNPIPLKLTQRCVVKLQDLGVECHSAAHIGCATGRATLELSKYFQTVLGTEFCGRLIDACLTIQQGKTVLFDSGEASLPSDTDPSKITFKQFTWLPNEVKFANFILLTVLDRAMNPKAWLARMNEILKPNGLLAVASSGRWGAPQLTSFIGKLFKLVGEEDVSAGPDKTYKLSFWQHK